MLVDLLHAVPSWLLVLLLAVSIAAESGLVVGMVLPGTTAVLAMGVLTGLGVVPATVGYVLAVGAAVLGPTLGWRAGRREGDAVRTSRLGARVGARRWAAAQEFVARRGTWAVALAQFVVVARTLVPRLVGMGRAPWRRFALASVPAAVLWAGLLTLLGQLAGASYEAVSAALGRATVSVGVLAAVLVALSWTGRQLARHPEWRAAPAVRAASAAARLVRRRIEVGTAGVVGERVGRVVSAVVWALAAVVTGVTTTVLVLLAVRRAGLRVVDDPAAAWFAAHASPVVTAAATGVVTVLRTPVVVGAAVLLALGSAVALRRRTAAEERLRVVVSAVGLVVLAVSTKVVADVAQGSVPGERTGFLFVNQVAVVPCALVLALVLLAPWLTWRRRVAAWTLVVLVVLVLVAARLLAGYSTLSEVVVALLVGAAWTALLAPAVRAPEVAGPEPAYP